MSGFILSLKIHIHTLNAELRSPVSIGTVFDSLVNIQNSQIMDKDTEKSGKCFNAAVHSPGFGKNSSVLGKNDTMKYGSAMPKPRNKKMLIEISIDD
ncbi:hypothetical protein GO685_00115 [Wolbachia endosymbiont of Madathamugadia hiepei]|uniref:hypothetical protein n=1 Tax=Wolbachia endosymbiont of Madathamugadia hiepei TaxID=1241303 RepID=UPI00158C0356|nr:hypothetical protein [Wolbachia endosymbiont of Madathamugadia hiepei]NUX00944.1 hypothetical protein [Wolbachia endosymbiont of Madathamugadia hiepei]